MAVEVVLSQGKVALIDAEDASRVLAKKWHFRKWGNSQKGYACHSAWGPDGKMTQLTLHRFVVSALKGELVDHINGDPLDCRKSNLRKTTQSVNSHNRSSQSNNSSGVPGVYFHKQSGKWRARLRVDGRHVSLGLYWTRTEAIAALVERKESIVGRHSAFMACVAQPQSGEMPLELKKGKAA